MEPLDLSLSIPGDYSSLERAIPDYFAYIKTRKCLISRDSAYTFSRRRLFPDRQSQCGLPAPVLFCRAVLLDRAGPPGPASGPTRTSSRGPGGPPYEDKVNGIGARAPGRGSNRLWVRNSLETPPRSSVFERMQANCFGDPGMFPLCSRLSCEIFRMYPGDALVSPFTPTSGWWSTSPSAARSAGVGSGAPTAKSSWPV